MFFPDSKDGVVDTRGIQRVFKLSIDFGHRQINNWCYYSKHWRSAVEIFETVVIGAVCIAFSVFCFYKALMSSHIKGMCRNCHNNPDELDGVRNICTVMEWLKNKDEIKEDIDKGYYTCRVCGGKITR
jgi:hypothetical protein